MTLAYPVDELLRVRQNVKASEEVLRKINESEAGIKGMERGHDEILQSLTPFRPIHLHLLSSNFRADV